MKSYIGKEGAKFILSLIKPLEKKLSRIEEEANKTVVDSSLSSTSTNPVQNKVIYEKIKNLTTTKNSGLQVNIDFNDVVAPGLFQYAFYCTAEERHAPELNTTFYVYNICRDENDMEQFALAEGKNKLYYRTRSTGTWSEWANILTSEHISQNFATEDWGMIAAAPLVKQLHEKNKSLADTLDKRTIGSFVKTGESPSSNVLDYAREYFEYGDNETTCYFLVRCSDKDGNSSLSVHKYVKWVSQNFFTISADGIDINDVNKWGTIILDDDTGKTFTISTITEEMYLTLKKINTTVEKISTNLNGLCIQKGIIYLNSGASGRIYFNEYKTAPTIILSCAVDSSKFYHDSVTVEQAMVYNNVGTTVGIEWIAIGIAK